MSEHGASARRGAQRHWCSANLKVLSATMGAASWPLLTASEKLNTGCSACTLPNVISFSDENRVEELLILERCESPSPGRVQMPAEQRTVRERQNCTEQSHLHGGQSQR